MRDSMTMVIFCGVAALAVGCGSPTVPPGPPGVEAIFGAPNETKLTPFPSNRYTKAASTPTGLQVDVASAGATDLLTMPETASTLVEIDELDGFSVTAGVFSMFSGLVDDASFTEKDGAPRAAEDFTTPDSPMLVVDVDPASPDFGVARPLVPRIWEQATDGWYEDEFTVLAQPATPLREGTRYLFVVTDAAGAEDGGPVKRSAMTEELISGATTGAFADEVRAALDVLGTSVGVEAPRVMLATTFTTMSSLHTDMLAVAEKARMTPVPALLEDWTVETMLQPDGRIRLRAVYDTPEYRVPLPDGKWKLGGDGKPAVQSQVGLEVFLAVSDANTSVPRIPVIYQHGLGGDKDGCWGTAERLAPINAAVFAIDSPYHGSRSGGGSMATAIFKFFGIDTTDMSFVLGRARDNFRQLSSDQLELVKLIQTLGTLDILPPGAPDGIPDFDVSKILYIGHSFGSVQGATVFSLAPEIKQAVWNVGGAGLTMLIRDSETFSTLIVDSMKPDGVSDGGVARFFVAAQAIMDPGDPLTYARYGTIEGLPGVPDWEPRDVLIQEVVADNIVPNSTSEALARAAGLSLADAIVPVSGMQSVAAPLASNLGGGATGGMTQFDLIEGGMTAMHGELIFSPEGIAQYLGFFQSGLANGHATIPPSYP